MLIRKCYLKDIKEYEEKHRVNILTLFNNISVKNMKEILSIIYRTDDEDLLYNVMDEYIDEGHGVFDLMTEIKNIVLGYDENKIKNLDEEKQKEIKDTYEDITSYEYLSDFYMHLCMQLMSLGMSYSEFWSLTTKEMYQAFEAIQQKMVMDYNRHMQEYYNLAGLISGGVWGKLPEEVPHIDIEDIRDPNEIIETEVGPMTREEYKIYKEIN